METMDNESTRQAKRDYMFFGGALLVIIILGMYFAGMFDHALVGIDHVAAGGIGIVEGVEGGHVEWG